MMACDPAHPGDSSTILETSAAVPCAVSPLPSIHPGAHERSKSPIVVASPWLSPPIDLDALRASSGVSQW